MQAHSEQTMEVYEGPEASDPMTERDLAELIEDDIEMQSLFKNASVTEHTYLRAWKAFMLFAQTKEPVEDHYKKYLLYLKEKKGYRYHSLRTKFSQLNAIHKKKFGFRLQTWPGIQDLVQSFEAEENEQIQSERRKRPSYKKIVRFTEDQMHSLFRLETNSREILLTKAFAAIMFSGKVRSEEIKDMNVEDLQLTQEGCVITIQQPKKEKGSEKSILLPYTKDDPSLCLASIVHKYVEALEEDIPEGELAGNLFKTLNYEDKLTNRPRSVITLSRIGRDCAALLRLPNPEQYTTGSFNVYWESILEKRKRVAKEKTLYTEGDIDFEKFPIAKVESPAMATCSKYKNTWLNFIKFCQSNNPTEKDYYDYFLHLRDKGATGFTLLAKRTQLNHYRRQLFGGCMKDFRSVTELLKGYEIHDGMTGNAGVRKFSVAELFRFFAMDLQNPNWILWKAIIAVVMSGGINSQELRKMQVSDMMSTEEGFWATYSSPNNPQLKKTFLIPYGAGPGPLTVPGICLAGTVKRYMDAISKAAEVHGGPLWKQSNNDRGFINEPYHKSLIAHVGNKVATLLELQRPRSYRLYSFDLNNLKKPLDGIGRDFKGESNQDYNPQQSSQFGSEYA